MPTNLENSAVATGLVKVSSHSNPKERQCKRMFKLLHNCTHLTCQQSNPQNSPSKASIVRELRTSRCTAGFRKGTGARDQIVNICWIIEKAREKKKKRKKEKAREFQKNIYFCFIDYTKTFDRVDHHKLWKILQEMGIPGYFTCLLRDLYAGQEAIVRTRHGTMDCFKIGKEVHQGYILSACLFNLYTKYIM